jgi:hypothetical protein
MSYHTPEFWRILSIWEVILHSTVAAKYESLQRQISLHSAHKHFVWLKKVTISLNSINTSMMVVFKSKHCTVRKKFKFYPSMLSEPYGVPRSTVCKELQVGVVGNRYFCVKAACLLRGTCRHWLCEILDFRRAVTEFFRLLGYNAEWDGYKPTFRD